MKCCWLVIPILLCSFAAAQEKLVRTGPFGTPVMVADEGGNFSTAIVVFETKDVEFVIPDITSAAWRAWNNSRISQVWKVSSPPLLLV